jgi:outer membrane receptor protein involved in Fe transport
LTQVTNSYYRNTSPRLYVDSAPHTVGNAALTLSGWRGFYSSLRYRHVGSYRLDGIEPSLRASGLDVLDLAITKSVSPLVEMNFAVDNLTNKRYYETQNYFESRVAPGAPVIERIHGTPGYPVSITVGLTLHFGPKEP